MEGQLPLLRSSDTCSSFSFHTGQFFLVVEAFVVVVFVVLVLVELVVNFVLVTKVLGAFVLGATAFVTVALEVEVVERVIEDVDFGPFEL